MQPWISGIGVGMFVQLYEMDAHVAVEVLGLKYMKGEQPHCGFPESAYTEMTAALVDKGHKVTVIEQTETPEQLRQRNEVLKKRGETTAKVVNREKVAVVTKGTVRDAEMMAGHGDAQYLMSIYARAGEEGGHIVGYCAVDVATSQVILGQLMDDVLMSQTRTQISRSLWISVRC